MSDKILNKNFLFFLVLFSVLCGKSLGQSEGIRYYDPDAFQINNPKDHLDIKVEWSIKGKSQAFMNEGLNELLEGNTARAITNFDTVLKDDDTFWPALYYRGICFKKTGKLVVAEVDLLRVISLKKDLIEAYLELGELYTLKKQYDLARDQYYLAIAIRPDFAMTHYFMGNLFLAMREPNKAIRQYEKCNEIDPSFPNSYFVQGMMKPRAGKKSWQEALSYFDKAIEVDSTFTPARFFRGLFNVSYFKQKEAALEDWTRLVQMKPDNLFYLCLRGYLLSDLERYDEAFSDFRKALSSSNPGIEEEAYGGRENIFDARADLKSVSQYLMRYGYGIDEKSFSQLKKAFGLAAIGKDEQALNALNQRDGTQASACYYLLKGVVFSQMLKPDSSISNYSKALTFDKDIFEAYEKRALYRFVLKDWRGAYLDMVQMRRLKPDAPILVRFSGMIKSNAKDYYGCLLDLGQFLKTDSTDADTWAAKADCHSKVGDYPNAIHDYEKSIALTTKNHDHYAGLYSQYILMKDTVAAFRTLRKMNSLWREDLVVRIEIAKFFFSYKDYDSSAFVLNHVLDDVSAIEKRPWNQIKVDNEKSEAMFMLAKIKKIKGRPQDALLLLNKAIRLDPDNCDKIFYRVDVSLMLGRVFEAKKDLNKLRAEKYLPAESLWKVYLDK